MLSLGSAGRASSPSRASTAPRWSRAERFFSLPAFPLETVVDPTGAGDTFAGGFMGYIAAHPAPESRPTTCCVAAIAYGTALASFNVEEFGTERVERLTAEEISERVEELHEITRFGEGRGNAEREAARKRPPRAAQTMKPVPFTAVSTCAAVNGVSNGPFGAISLPAARPLRSAGRSRSRGAPRS